MTEDSKQTITSSLKRFFSGTLLSRFTGLGREVIMAAAFGTTPLVASFWMAFRFSHLLRRLFGEGALHVAFVPHFESLRKSDPKKAASFFYDLSTKVTYALLGLTLLLEVVLGGFLLYGALNADNAEIVRLTMIMLPSVIFISLHALNSSLLQCERRYFLPSASPVILNLIWIGCIVWMWKALPLVALRALAIVVVFAFALQWLSTQIPTAKYLKRVLGDKMEKRNQGELLALLRPFFLGMVGVAAVQINNGLDALFARWADPEGPAILWYALRLQQLPLALLGVGLSGALLPPISRAIQSGEHEKAIHFLNFSLGRIFTFMIPITAATFALGFVSVNMVYGRGEFNTHSLIQTSHSLWAYGLGLLPMTATLILAAAFYAMKEYKIPTLLSLLSVALNVALNAWFVYGWGLGAISIAYATSLAAFFNAIFLSLFLKKRVGAFSQGLFSSSLRVTLASVSACLCTCALSTYFHLESYPRDLPSQLAHFATQTLLFVSALVVFSTLFRAKEILALLPLRKSVKN
jgi:putative peptidoglycan lipid II flippase